MPMPDSMEIYPGTSGNTHGDKNEISPARNAPAKETSVIPDSSSYQASESDLIEIERELAVAANDCRLVHSKGP